MLLVLFSKYCLKEKEIGALVPPHGLITVRLVLLKVVQHATAQPHSSPGPCAGKTFFYFHFSRYLRSIFYGEI